MLLMTSLGSLFLNATAALFYEASVGATYPLVGENRAPSSCLDCPAQLRRVCVGAGEVATNALLTISFNVFSSIYLLLHSAMAPQVR